MALTAAVSKLRAAGAQPRATGTISLPRVSGTSLHRQLFLVLRDQIVAGTLPEGAALPKEETLCEQFGVSRITVRRALSDLAAQGLVQRRHGIGTYVLPGAAPARAGLTLSFLDHLRRVGAETQVRVIDLKREVPAPSIAALLLLPPGEPAIHAVRLRSTGSIPLMVTDAWIPADLGQKITRAALEKKALFELLMHQGIRFGRVVQEISAESAPPQLARLLATETGSALLRLVRLMHDRKERPVEYLTVHMTPERSRILMEISADAIDTLNAGHLVHDPALASQTTS